MNRKVLITGATGDTGRAAVKESIARGLTVRAMVHGRDDSIGGVGKAWRRSRDGQSPQYRFNPRGHGRD